MVEFKRIYGVRASLSQAGLARISRSNKLPIGFQGVGTIKLRRRRVVTGVFVLALCLLILSGVANGVKADPVARDFVPGQVVGELAPGVSIQQINRTYGTTKIGQIPNSNLYLFEIQDGSSVANTVKKMGTDTKRVVFAEPNFVVDPPMANRRHRAFGISDAEPSPLEDAASALNLSIARNISQGQGTTVAVLDTGMQLDHPALKDNLVEEAKRYDFVDNDTNPSDTPVGLEEDGNGLKDEMVGHGTHVAGIVDLVAPKAKIMPLRVLDTEGYGDVFTIAKAISFATSNGANVINLSLGSPNQSRLLQKVIKDANLNKQNRVLVAAAAGNSNSSTPYYPAAGGSGAPASADGLVAVSSVNSYGQKSDFANYGKWVDIAAPGESIRSAFPISEYAYWSGTSMSTPFVSGEAALIYSVSPSLTPVGVEQRIYCSARPLTATDPVYGAMLGAGHADVGASLTPGFCNSSAPPWTTITAGPWGPPNTASAMFGFASSKAGSTFECKLDDAPFGACTSPKAVSNLSDGQHTFSVRATDASGKTDSTPALRTWSVDTTAPDAPIIDSPADDSYINSGDITVSGTAESGSTVELFEGDASEGTATADAQGSWSIKLTGVAEGVHTYVAKATDAANNTSAPSADLMVTVDTTPPTVVSVTPEENAADVAISDNVAVTFSEEMDGSTIDASTFKLTKAPSNSPIDAVVNYDAANDTATLDPKADLDPSATYTATFKGGTNGARDSAGNPLGADKVWSFTTPVPVDTTSPETTIDSGPTVTVNSDSATFAFSSSEAGSSFECSLDAGAYSACTSPMSYTGLADGFHTFSVRATDATSNADSTPDSRTWTVDTTAPTITG
jgi:thermitase